MCSEIKKKMLDWNMSPAADGKLSGIWVDVDEDEYGHVRKIEIWLPSAAYAVPEKTEKPFSVFENSVACSTNRAMRVVSTESDLEDGLIALKLYPMNSYYDEAVILETLKTILDKTWLPMWKKN